MTPAFAGPGDRPEAPRRLLAASDRFGSSSAAGVRGFQPNA